jgi:hypothetical protein
MTERGPDPDCIEQIKQAETGREDGAVKAQIRQQY